MARSSAMVICPGRGTYNRDELGYLARHHADKAELVQSFDEVRDSNGQDTISALDAAARYSVSKYSRGDNASGLIYACALADFLSIDQDSFDIVAVTGNSMGWYIALACGGALDVSSGFNVVNTMGTLMHETLIGGQLLYPFVDQNWCEIPGKKQEMLALTESIPNLYLSILLGGMIVFAGDDTALSMAEARLEPVQDRLPLRLANHAGFHSPLQSPVSAEAKMKISSGLFRQPQVPLIDGRGQTWFPKASNLEQMWDYTFGSQIVDPYDFTTAIVTGLREFAPDVVIVLGPGKTLGGAVAQSIISANWHGIDGKDAFVTQQSKRPFVLSMGIDEQRALTEA